MNTLITGGASGLGACLARRAIARSPKVVAVDKNWSPSASDGVIAITADLSDLKALPDLAASLASHGPFTTLVHNAAISATGKAEEISASAYEKLFDLNLKAPLLLTQSLLKRDLLPPGATIVHIASLSVKVGYPGASAYAATKAALANYGNSQRKGLAHHGIHTLNVFPGPMKTEQARRHAPPGAKEQARMDPDAVARNIWFAVDRRQREFIPGTWNELAAGIGWMSPRFMDRLMRRLIFDKLDKTVF